MPAQVTAEQVADYLIHFSHEVGDPITNLKLQKLLYYAQAWYLALHDKPLFDDQIEAWVRGPVVPNVWRKYKDYKWSPIATEPGVVRLPDEVMAHLDEIMKVYGTLPAFHLERLTHQEAPWQHARGGRAADEPSNEIISLDDMRDFYRQMAQEDGNQEEQASP